MAASQQRQAISATFSFVDLSGYTAAAWAHGDDVAADLAIRLMDLARRYLGPSDDFVKSMGDAVMCRSDTPAHGLALVARVFTASAEEVHFPHVRAGVHHGPAVTHACDFFGTTVNVAARVAALARPGEMLTSRVIADEAISLGWCATLLGSRELRNVADPVEVWDVSPPELDSSSAVDPVCRMRVTPTTEATELRMGGITLRFCSTACRNRFESDPARWFPR
ncbi:MAG: YHS domain-containing protein [Actinobacteria bacterium]|nr:YHS domain-containing protein [Actinomycetota bacterium]